MKALKCQICLTITKPFLWESEENIESLQKRSPDIWVSYKFVLKSIKILTRISWATEYWLKAFKCQIWLMYTKPFFWETEENVETFQKRFPYIWVSYKLVLKWVKVLNSILWSMESWFKVLKWHILLRNTKPFFLEGDANVEPLQKLSPSIWVFYKFVLKSIKSLNRILWATEYWFRALKCQFNLSNTKPCFLKSEANVESLQKRFSYIWVSYKFLLKSAQILNRISRATEYWFKALKCQIWLMNTKSFFWESEANSSKTLCLYLSSL